MGQSPSGSVVVVLSLLLMLEKMKNRDLFFSHFKSMPMK
jgi:hypothetical protein